MRVSTFSPHTFYKLVTGEPLDATAAFSAETEANPSPGLTIISRAPDGLNHAAWIWGLVRTARLRERFISTIEEGEIPIPYFQGTSFELGVRVRYNSVDELYTNRVSVGSVLGISSILERAALRSDSTLCPCCGGFVRLFH